MPRVSWHVALLLPHNYIFFVSFYPFFTLWHVHSHKKLKRDVMQKVVVLGGGYAGVHAVRTLAKNRSIEIVLIDKHTYHNLQPEVYNYIASKSDLTDVTVDLYTLCEGIEHPRLSFMNKRVVDCDLDGKKLLFSDGGAISYDYLLLAYGARTFFPRAIEGLKNTDDLKKLHRALMFKQSFECSMLQKVEDECSTCQEGHIVIVGAGLSGVEIAAEMAHFSKKFFQHGTFACDNMKISLISGSGGILKGLHPKLIAKAKERLHALGVNVIEGAHMQKCDEGFVYLQDGQKLPYSFVIFAGGIEASNISSKINLPKNSKAQLLPNRFLQVEGYDEVFVAGDAAEVRDAQSGRALAPCVLVAKHSSECAAENILARIQKRELRECRAKVDGVLVALGGRYAACDLFGKIFISGFLGYLLKEFVFLRYKLPLQRISRLGYKKHKRGVQ